MKYTENDIKLGTKIICKDNGGHSWWKKGKIYEVVKSKNTNELVVLDDEEDEREIRIVEHYLNNDLKLKFELIKEENNMQEFKVGDLVEVISNPSCAVNEIGEPYNKGDLAVITNVYSTTVRLGNNRYANLIKKTEIKKVEQSPELTEYEEEIVLRLADKIKQKDEYIKELEYLDSKVKDIEILLEDKQKEIDFEVKKLLTK